MILHYNLTIQGKVQGVNYRRTAKQMADIMGITGFVRNELNGNVYCEAEGEESLLIRFVQWCHHGPDSAVVQKVSITDGPIQNFEGFEIRR